MTTIAYKTVLRDGEDYRSINRALAGQTHRWEMGVTQTAPGGADHSTSLFAYPSALDALEYASENAPNGEVCLLACEVEATPREGKLFCTAIRPIREIPVRRGSTKGITLSKIAGSKAPIRIVPGNASPTLRGEGFYWTTPSGKTRVEHPNAYGWPTVYHPSTRRIAVGEDWSPVEIDRDTIYSTDEEGQSAASVWSHIRR